jgi:hypothetical protein
MMGVWAVRFRVAAAACCGAVVVLVVAGLVSGVTYSLPTAPGTKAPRGFAAEARAQTLLTGTNLFTATLLVIALLLLVVAGTDGPDGPDGETPAPDRRMSRAVMILAAIVALGTVASAVTTVWYWSISSEPLPVLSVARPLGEAVSGAIVATAAVWWARAVDAR